MGVFKNSRYSNTYLYPRSTGGIAFKNREKLNVSLSHSKVRVWKEGDTLYNIAFECYGDTQLYWVILDANPSYRWEGDIPKGAHINIPNYNEVMKCLKY